MKHTLLAPNVGESITEVSLLKWTKQQGQRVQAGELVLEIESDKATVELVAEASGQLTILVPEGTRVAVGSPLGIIDDSVIGNVEEAAVAGVAPTAMNAAPSASHPIHPTTTPSIATSIPQMGPAARKIVAETGVDPSKISGTGKEGRITPGDLKAWTSPQQTQGSPTASIQAAPPALLPIPVAAPTPPSAVLGQRRVPMSNLRARIAERLVQAQHTAAILTTFNEVDMSAVMAVRKQHKESFQARHGVALSFMSFFTRASIEALRLVPEINASIEGRDILYHDSYDIGIAVGSERGLVVPVVKNAGNLSFVELEKKIAELALKARNNKLSIADLSGGTFTVSNGGVYGSLLSTPILNPPQSGILGMHKIQERPVVIQGKVEVRPMMYLALSYDHRLIDGKGAVTFLVTLKDFLEHPEKLGMDF